MRALDLFCGAGGAAMGLHRAGFEVVGVDLARQNNYPFDYILADALCPALDIAEFDLIWASPPCQAYTALRRMPGLKDRAYPDLVEPVRGMLKASGVPYVIENVSGAPLARGSVMLCGTMFGLTTLDESAELRRHRWFECSWPTSPFPPQCDHGAATIGVYGGHLRDRRRSVNRSFARLDGSRAMGVGWMPLKELSQAIPPAYSEWVARDYLASCTTRKS